MISLAYAALWIFVFSMPWDTLSAGAGVVIVTKVTGILALGLTLLAVVGSGQIRRLRLFHVAALLFVIWAGFGLLILNTQGLLSDYGLLENQRKFYTYVQLLPVLWMVWELAPSRSRALGLLTAYVFGCYIAAFGTFMVYRRDAEVLRRFAAGGGDPNDMAMTLVLALPMAWYLGMTYRQPLLRWACRAYLPVGLVALGFTGSRGGFIATMVALLIVPFTMGGLSAGEACDSYRAAGRFRRARREVCPPDPHPAAGKHRSCGGRRPIQRPHWDLEGGGEGLHPETADRLWYGGLQRGGETLDRTTTRRA